MKHIESDLLGNMHINYYKTKYKSVIVFKSMSPNKHMFS